MSDTKEALYFKYLNSYGDGDKWWLYLKIIKDNGDGDTCQVFKFEKTTRDSHFSSGIDFPFVGNFDTNKYSYYENVLGYEKCTKEEFERELDVFMEQFNKWIGSVKAAGH